MIRLKTLGAAAALGLVWGCSGEAENPLTSPFNPSVEDDDVQSGAGTGVVGDGSGSAGRPTGSAGTGSGSSAGSSTVDEVEVPAVVNPDGSVAKPFVLRGSPLYTRVMRLTNEQWEHAVQDVLRLPQRPEDKSTLFETAVVGQTDFTNNESLLTVTNTQWNRYQLAAEEIVAELTASDAAFAGVYSGTDADGFIREVGQRAFRRPLTEDEVDAYQAIYDTGAALSGSQSAFTKGAGLVVEGLLQSPNFLYRTELGPDDQQLGGYEIAAKLSLLLRGTNPDDALLQKAASGGLNTVAAVVAQAQSMLEEDGVAQTISDFHAEMFEFKRIADISKEAPEFTPAVAAELVQASRAFFEHIYSDGLGLEEILTTREGYVGPATASFYGVPAPNTLSRVELGPERSGFFSQLPYLMVYARGAQSYAILRGVHVNHDVLCAELDPPTGVVNLATTGDFKTSRELMEVTTETCGLTCHNDFINPLGFAFENFDGLGRWRTTDAGEPVDATGTYPFTGGRETFDGVPELMEKIVNNDMAHKCYAKNVAGYALQRDLTMDDEPLISKLAAASDAEQASVKDLIIKLIQEPAFHSRPGAK